MPVLVELPAPGATYAFQEEIGVRVVFRAEEGEQRTRIPEPLLHPDVLRLVLRHADGTEEDRSPSGVGLRPPPPVRVRASTLPESAVALNLAAPAKPGSWSLCLQVSVEGRRLTAPEVAFTVLPPIALALLAASAAQEPGVRPRVVQLAAEGIVLEHRLLRGHDGEELIDGVRLARLDPPPEDLRISVAVPGVDADPAWLLGLRGELAEARSLSDRPVRAQPLALRAAGEPAPVWLGPPLVVDHARTLLLAWAVGATLRVARIDARGGIEGPVTAALPGPIARGAAVADPDGGVRVLFEVIEAPDLQQARSALPRLGSAADPPRKGRPAPPAPEHVLWGLRLPGRQDRGAPPPLADPAVPQRVAVLPASTVALTGTSGGVGAPSALWGVERSGRVAQAFRLPLLAVKDGVGIGRPERHPLGAGLAVESAPAAVDCPEPGLLRAVFLERDVLVVVDTSGRAGTWPMPAPRPDRAGFAGGRLLLHDLQRGLYLP